MVASRYTVHHGIAFGVTFITYAFFHAARKTLSNSKDSISIFWTEGEFNQTWPAPHDNEIWKRPSLAPRNGSAIFVFLLQQVAQLQTPLFFTFLVKMFVN